LTIFCQVFVRQVRAGSSDNTTKEIPLTVQISERRGTSAQVGCGVLAALVAGVLTVAQPVMRGQPAATGSIAGRVRITARVRGAALSTNVYAARAVSVPDSTAIPEMRSVVVYLKDAPFHGSLPLARRQIRQEHEAFVPRVVAITRGSTVDFPNSDPFFHNVFSLSGGASFDLGRYPDGQSRSRQFTRAGLVKVFCHIHSQMSASILVLDHPYFVTPEDNGAFTIANVPAGNYTLVAWHERVGEQLTRVAVQAGQATTIEMALPVADLR
jgi:plastocyanin